MLIQCNKCWFNAYLINYHVFFLLTKLGVIVKDPVLIRGAGNITIFGVSNRFSEQFPTQLNAKLAPEEFKDTIKQINNILNKELANSLKWLVFGSIFCCCTLGCSLLPVIFMNKKARLSINKLLEMENQRLYLKLGLKWRLAKVKCNSNALLEYVLLIEFLPTILLYQPDWNERKIGFKLRLGRFTWKQTFALFKFHIGLFDGGENAAFSIRKWHLKSKFFLLMRLIYSYLYVFWKIFFAFVYVIYYRNKDIWRKIKPVLL